MRKWILPALGCTVGGLVIICMLAGGGWLVWRWVDANETQSTRADRDGGDSDDDTSSEREVSPDETEEPAERTADSDHGEEIFQSLCAACHGADATGIQGLGKNLTTSEFAAGLSDEELVAFIIDGRPASDPDNTTGVDMPPRGGNPSLTDEDLADVVVYIRTLAVDASTSLVTEPPMTETPIMTEQPMTEPVVIPTETEETVEMITATPEAPLGIGSTQISSIDGAVLVFVPSGEFLMVSSAEDNPNLWGSEYPPHDIFLNDFWIYQTEVTNSMYQLCVEDGSCNPPQNSGSETRASYYGNQQFSDYPVIQVTWIQANNYCEWAGGRLPSEAEWEKAARGTDGRLFPWGNDDPTGSMLNLCDENCPRIEWRELGIDDGYPDTAPVGSFPQGISPYGAYDMAGNVWEWVADWYLVNYYSQSPVDNPQGPTSGTEKVMRGGSWINNFGGAFNVVRYKEETSAALNSLGFRCVVD